jgi:hypothetical protein
MIKAREPRPSVARETPLVRRSDSPFATLDRVLLLMIEQHEGKPCPTRKDIREWTGMPRRKIWAYLEGMRARGLIEMEVREAHPEGGTDPKLRRMRKADGIWTLWTARSKVTA